MSEIKIGSQLVTNATGGLLSNANNSGHAEGTTQSAVSDGSVIVRNEDKQKQDVNELNRDTEHANDGSINPIFDKEKEQNRLKQSQLIGEIGNQAMDIIRTEGEIAGYKAQKDPDALAIAKKQLEAAGKTPQKVAEERINAEIEHYKKENCAGMSTGACSAKMAEDRDKFFREAASLGIDFVPVVGDFKSFAEADGWIDYTLAAAGTLPFAKIFTKPLKEAKLLLKAGDLDGANKLIKEASDGIPTKLPSSPASQSSSGVWKPDHGVEVNTGSGKQKDSQIWTETKKTDPASNAYDHWDKHKSEFPEFQNSKQYVEAAHDFVNTPPKGTLIKERANGDTMYYNPATNTFAVKMWTELLKQCLNLKMGLNIGKNKNDNRKFISLPLLWQ